VNLLTLKPIRIPLAVIPFMVVQNYGNILVEGFRQPKYLGPLLRVFHDYVKLVIVEWNRLVDDVVWNMNFSYVVKKTRYLKLLELLCSKTEALAYQQGESGDS